MPFTPLPPEKVAKLKGAKKDAYEAELREYERQQSIDAGRKNIDSAFAGYNPKYYQGFRNKTLALQNANIDDQYADARDKLASALAGRGMEASTPGIRAFGEARETYDDSRLKAATEADSAVSDLKTRVASRKSDLYSLNQAAADPQGATAQAVGAATALAAPVQYNPLADIFSGLINTYSSLREDQSYQLPTPYRYKPSSSGKVIY